jgi:hypothetical protein
MVNTTLRPLCHWERPGTHRIGGWVGHRAGLDGPGKLCRPPRFDPQAAQPVACCYTGCAVSAYLRIVKKLNAVYWLDLERPVINMTVSPIKCVRSYEKRKYITILWKLVGGSYTARLLSLSNYLICLMYSAWHSYRLYHRLWCSSYATFYVGLVCWVRNNWAYFVLLISQTHLLNFLSGMQGLTYYAKQLTK